MFRYPLVLFSSLLFLMGCAARMKVEPLSADHPASPHAPEAPYSGGPTSLRPEPQDTARPDSPGSAVHPDVNQAKPGVCSRCGMKLVEKQHKKDPP